MSLVWRGEEGEDGWLNREVCEDKWPVNAAWTWRVA